MQYIKKIENLLAERKIHFQDLAGGIGMSRQGLKNSFNTDTLKVTTLIDIAKFFNVPINYFFDEKQKNAVDKDDVIDEVFDALKEVVKQQLK